MVNFVVGFIVVLALLSLCFAIWVALSKQHRARHAH